MPSHFKETRMFFPSLRQLVQRMQIALRRDRPSKARRGRKLFRPRLEVLEDRTVPNAVSWINGSGSWSDASHWLDATTGTNHVPGTLDDAVIDVSGVTVTLNGSRS